MEFGSLGNGQDPQMLERSIDTLASDKAQDIHAPFRAKIGPRTRRGSGDAGFCRPSAFPSGIPGQYKGVCTAMPSRYLDRHKTQEIFRHRCLHGIESAGHEPRCGLPNCRHAPTKLIQRGAPNDTGTNFREHTLDHPGHLIGYLTDPPSHVSN